MVKGTCKKTCTCWGKKSEQTIPAQDTWMNFGMLYSCLIKIRQLASTAPDFLKELSIFILVPGPYLNFKILSEAAVKSLFTWAFFIWD